MTIWLQKCSDLATLVPTLVALRTFIMQVLACQLHFQANRNAGLAILPLFWPVNYLKIGGHVALLSGPTVYSVNRDQAIHMSSLYNLYFNYNWFCELFIVVLDIN